jgi:hypothetical protein
MRFGAILLIAYALCTGAAAAAEPPSGPVILTVSGAISNANVDSNLLLDETALAALPVVTVKTETPWTQGMVTFEGVPLKALLDLAGATGSVIHAVALNDYAVDVPVSDAENPEVILAYRLNGEKMRVRDKGPLWLIYPLSGMPELQTPATHSKMIWQIKELSIR